jgi:F-type H+-transporting ATPase subunit epsilon
MSHSLHLEIISPTGVLFKGACHMVVIPSIEGDIGVMHGHESIMVTLKAGQIAIYDDKQNITKTFDVENGFAEQSAEKFLILVG